LLGLRVRIPPGLLIFVFCVCCVLSGEPSTTGWSFIQRSYRLWCII
jgi:hypothetical protein